MEKRIETAWLLSFYGPLLTQRQRELLALYCDEDFSLAEIAAQEDISRQGVYDAVHRAQRQLADYEARLGLLARYRRITQGLERCRAMLDGVQASRESEAALAHVKRALDALIADEEGQNGV